MSAKKKANPRNKETFKLAQTDREAIQDWLKTLREDEFRDKILPDVFVGMKSAGLIESFKNIHGRNDKGVDFVVVENSPLSRRVIGIQVKSNKITRSSGPNSAREVISECEAAMQHNFTI
ncbi:hypothetical protein EON80_27005, partial [bacterium]